MKSNPIIKIHLLLIGLVILNAIAKSFFNIGFVNWIDDFFKIAIVITGVWVFLKNIKPFKKINYYFAIYPISIVVGLLAFLFKGMFGMLIMSILLFPFNMNKSYFNKDGIAIYDNSKGFMDMCCSYKATEKKFFIFEKVVGTFKHEGVINFKEAEVNQLSEGIELIFNKEQFDKNSNSYILKKEKILIGN